MKAWVIEKGSSNLSGISLKEVESPKPLPHEVLIQNEVSGLNFADVMASKGLYRDAPPLPFVPGYDVVGKIVALGNKTENLQMGDRVCAFTRFSGCAEYSVAAYQGVVVIDKDWDASEAVALSTQYCTALYAAKYLGNIRSGERVLIHSAAGGVGRALVQYAKYAGCEIIATAGSHAKCEQVKNDGAHIVINYNENDFSSEIISSLGKKSMDVVFDAVGGENAKKGIQLLGPGGRFVGYGASSLSQGVHFFNRIPKLLSFGFYHPGQLMMSSISICGVNMLHIADKKPNLLKQVFDDVMELRREGVLVPGIGTTFSYSDYLTALHKLANRETSGKVCIRW